MAEGIESSSSQFSVTQAKKELMPLAEAKEQEGLRVNFAINNKHLITHALSSMGAFSSTEHQEDIVALQNYAWDVSERAYNFLVGRVPPEQFFASGGNFEEVTDFFFND